VGVRLRPSQLRSAVRLADAAAVWKLRERHGALRPPHRPTHRRSGGEGCGGVVGLYKLNPVDP
jgi:hypothetical protein